MGTVLASAPHVAPPGPAVTPSGRVVAEGRRALSALTRDAVAVTAARAVVVRDAVDDLVALAGDPLAALPVPRSQAAAPPQQLTVAGRPVGTVVVVDGGPLPTDLADALALALALPVVDPADLLAEVDAERDAVADALHDGPLQSLVAARYAADLTRDAEGVRGQVQDALADLRALCWRLRPRTCAGLGEALAALADHAGGRLSLTRSGHEVPVAAAAGALAYRVAVGAVERGAQVHADLADGVAGLVLDLSTGDADVAQRLAGVCAARAAALGVTVTCSGDRLVLHLPAAGLPPTTPQPDLPAPNETGTDR